MKKAGIIYIITNLITGKVYVGQTTDRPEVRFSRHRTRNTGMPIHLAIKKYGVENFKFEVIYSAFTLDELNFAEEFFIKKYNSLSPNGYNLISGGLNHRRTQEMKDRHSRIMKGKKFPSRRRGIIATNRTTGKTIETEVVKDFLDYGFTKSDLSNIRWMLVPNSHKKSVKNWTFKYKDYDNSDLITESKDSVAVQRLGGEPAKQQNINTHETSTPVLQDEDIV